MTISADTAFCAAGRRVNGSATAADPASDPADSELALPGFDLDRREARGRYIVAMTGSFRAWVSTIALVTILTAGCTGNAGTGAPASPSAAVGSVTAAGSVPAGSSIPAGSTQDDKVTPASQTAASQTAGSQPAESPAPSSDLVSPDPSSEGQSSGSGAPPSTSTSPEAVAPLPDVGLTGVNVPDCQSDRRPLILLHGTFSTAASNFSAMLPALLASGRCVYAIDYGNQGLASVQSSAGQFAGLVNSVLALTGRTQVDVVGYSQGGLVLRTGLRLNGLADKVATAILISPSWNGTTSPLAGSLPAGACPSCVDQTAGSALLRQLDGGGDMDGAVRYAEISTKADNVVTPVSSQVPQGPADRVRSLVVENQCPQLVTDHTRMPATKGVIAWVVAALNTDGRPPASALTC